MAKAAHCLLDGACPSSQFHAWRWWPSLSRSCRVAESVIQLAEPTNQCGSATIYLYQFTFYSVWFWFSAIIWGCPQMIVVLGCGLLSIFITRRNQQSIAEITKINATCTILRDGSWKQADSTELVPGDKLKLTERGWVLPCDLILIQGTCITDESGLTGESMPVRKSELPSTAALENTNYDEDKDSKHTLYAGTTLLQAGSGETDEVLAVV